MSYTKTFVALFALALLPLAAAAPVVDAGIGSQCHDSSPSPVVGTGGATTVNVAGEIGTIPTVVLVGLETIPAQLVALGNDPLAAAIGQGCSSPGNDHLQVHVLVNGSGAGACYNGAVHTTSAPCYP